MAQVTANPEFIASVRLGAEAGVETMVDVYLPAIAFKLSEESGPRTGRRYLIPDGSRQASSTKALGEHEFESDVFDEVSRIHIASAPGQAPAVLTGVLRESAVATRAFNETDAQAFIGPNAVNPEDGELYGQALEHGTDRIAPRPAWLPVLAEHFGAEGDGLLEGAFNEGFRNSAA